MVWNRLQASVKQFIAGPPEAPQLSRRGFLAGVGAFGAVGVVGTGLLAPSAAQAAIVDLDADEVDAEIIEARSHDRGRRRGRRRRRGRGRRRRGRRMSAREVRRRCRGDRSFRRRNRALCQRTLGWRGRRGACIQIGPFQICE